MSDTTRMLDDLAPALAAGRLEDVMAALGDAVIEVDIAGQAPQSLVGGERDSAVAGLLAGFDRIAVTVVSRTTRATTVTDSAVVSGLHVGPFAGSSPTGNRVRINVSATAISPDDDGVARLRVTPDLRALWTQIGDSADSLGTASALMAMIRENEARATLQWEPDADQPAARPASAPPVHARQRGRRGSVLLTLLGVVGIGLVALVGWRWLGTAPPNGAEQARAEVTPTATSLRTASSTASATPTPSVTRPPVIATEKPTSVPKVQPGRQLVLTSDVLFKLGSATLTPNARQALAHLAAQIREADVSGTIQVNGYTDNLGTPASNITLSRARALAVARSLQPALAGMPVTLRPQGFGEVDPVATNATAAGRAKNRRVTVVLPR